MSVFLKSGQLTRHILAYQTISYVMSGLISSCQSAANSEIAKCFCSRVSFV